MSVEAELVLEHARALARRRIAWLRATWPAEPAFAGLAIGHDEAERLAAPDLVPPEPEFFDDDPAARAAADEVAAAAHALAVFRGDASAEAPLAAIAAALGLDAFELEVLGLALSAELDPGFARLCAYLQDDARRPHLSVRLVLDLLVPAGGALPAQAAALGEGGRLAHHDLVRVEGDGPWSARTLRLADGVLGLVVGGAPEPALAGALTPLASAGLPERHEALAGRAARLLVAVVQAGGAPLLSLTGEATAPLHAVAAAAAARLGRTAFLLQPARLPVARPAALLDREAALSGLAYVVDEALPEDWPPLESVVFVTGREPATGAARVEVPAPTYAERRQLLAGALAAAGAELDDAPLARTAAQFPLEADALAQAVRVAVAEADGTAPLEDTLWRACRTAARRSAAGLAWIIEPRRTWNDLVLPDPLVLRLHELVAQAERRPVVYDEWGFGARVGRARGITALFAGPSGTGKTLAAEVVAGALGCDLQRIDLAGVVDKYIGETEKHLRTIFDAAESSGALLFFDEADALFGKRTDVRDSHDRYANIEVDYLLQRMEDYPGLAVLATNRKGALDPAFLRRLRFVLDFPFPDAASRRSIWETALPREAPTDGLDLDALARLELAGGSIVTVAVNAAFAAAAQDVPIGMSHLASAARAELAKLERLVRESALEDWLEPAR
ncbi:MAG TPA: ATP-binding protein [Gaiellaceae bacterium]|nr:ATP-binding protein [Gaiellaceae bacterium]